jgi:polyphenol oxidase
MSSGPLKMPEKNKIVENKYGSLQGVSLSDFPLWHCFFFRSGGFSKKPYSGLNTAYKTKDPDAPLNRQLLFQSTGIINKSIRILNPCHGKTIAFVSGSEWEKSSQDVLWKTDAAFTDKTDTFFLVSSADCISLLLTDQKNSFAGIVHLGWRNIVSGLVKDTIIALELEYKINPETIIAAIGPSIYPCCYIFASPEQEKDPFWQSFLTRLPDGKISINLISAVRKQLEQAGLISPAIVDTGLCTGCHNDLFYSCYREGYISGRFPCLIGLTK